LIHVVRGRRGCLFHLTKGKLLRSSWHLPDMESLCGRRRNNVWLLGCTSHIINYLIHTLWWWYHLISNSFHRENYSRVATYATRVAS